MAIWKRNLIRVVILFVFALSALGFRNSPDSPAQPADNSLSQRDYIDVLIWRDFLWEPPNFWFYGITEQVPVTLKIGPIASDFSGDIQVAEAYGYLPTIGIGVGGFTSHGGHVHRWEISGTFDPSPDCSLILVINEDMFPHTEYACHPLVGCVPTSFPAEHFPNIVVHVPLNNGYGTAKAGADSPGLSGHVHVAVVNADFPDENCESVLSTGLP
ncbi:MAG: hypothetical protein WBB69_10280 [Anaerolineales bacterium]